MQIIITVRTGNAAMQTWDDVECAVAEAVDKAAVRFDASAEPRAGDTIGVWDVNGNRVGALTVVEDR